MIFRHTSCHREPPDAVPLEPLTRSTRGTLHLADGGDDAWRPPSLGRLLERESISDCHGSVYREARRVAPDEDCAYVVVIATGDASRLQPLLERRLLHPGVRGTAHTGCCHDRTEAVRATAPRERVRQVASERQHRLARPPCRRARPSTARSVAFIGDEPNQNRLPPPRDQRWPPHESVPVGLSPKDLDIDEVSPSPHRRDGAATADGLGANEAAPALLVQAHEGALVEPDDVPSVPKPPYLERVSKLR